MKTKTPNTTYKFPYVTSGLSAFLDRTWESPELKAQIELLRVQVSCGCYGLESFQNIYIFVAMETNTTTGSKRRGR
jgi:hypothetical protein